MLKYFQGPGCCCCLLCCSLGAYAVGAGLDGLLLRVCHGKELTSTQTRFCLVQGRSMGEMALHLAGIFRQKPT